MRKLDSQPIDFVITWVDGADAKWLQEKKKYNPSIDVDDSIVRYRDFGTLKYVLRSIEKFAPWVRNIYLITDGQIPEWISFENPKLKLIKHTDFIPESYLPVFSSHPIEWNFHRIESLSENFLYFNDDVILTAPVNPSDFFQGDLPCDTFGLDLLVPKGFFSHICFNNMMVINEHFNIKKTLKANKKKFFSLKYGKKLLANFILSTRGGFSSINNPHITLAFKKSYFKLLWEKEPVLIDNTCRNRIRSSNDINCWLVRYWQLLTGNFIPRSNKFGRFYNIQNFIQDKDIKKKLKKGKYKVVCVNDSESDKNESFHQEQERFKNIMDVILYNKCSFEK